ncbi:FliO/MopB family protein [Planctomycetes bacterium K23_9]|uniref:Flagellar biosynthesis protein, FliO n=1 Tax=Stieleria marina TaxID=1930275 RepID=A0A517NND2_9BACT|nr:Flagellar biosynthesis protein, FliO [Planctomycetes bacterium K23_9]
MQNPIKQWTVVALLSLMGTSTVFAQQIPNHDLAQSPARTQRFGRAQHFDSSRPIDQTSYETPLQPPRDFSPPADSGFPTLVRSTSNDQPTVDDDPSKSKSFGPLVTTGFSLVVVLGLFAGLVWVTRRYGNASMTQTGLPTDAMKSLGSTAIDARTRITLLRCGSRIIVMAQTATGVHPLSEITEPIEVQRLTAMCNGESVSAIEPTFAEALRNANRQPATMAFSS